MNKRELNQIRREVRAIEGLAVDSVLEYGRDSYGLVLRDIWHGGTIKIETLESWESRQADWAAAPPKEDWPTVSGLPVPGTIAISVWNNWAAVIRYVAIAGGVTTQLAGNAADLSASAAEAVRSAGGALNVSGHYPCPPELAARAHWGDRA